jgi:16S rRNA (cytosine967-C5)-methyltransferase
MTAREVALAVLERAEREDRFIDNVFELTLLESPLDERDRRLAQEIVYGVTKLRKHLDFIIDHFREGRSPRGFLRTLLRVGTYQILFTDRIPDYAAIDESVKLAAKREPNTTGFVNALLRRVTRERSEVSFPNRLKKPVDYLSIFHSHPEWLVRRWLERYDLEATERLCKANNEPPPLCIRTNTYRISVEELLRRLEEEGMQVRAGRYRDYLLRIEGGPPLGRSPSFRQGLFQVQDESAALVSELLDPKPREQIVDMCASPGGKTTHLAQLMADDGLILAVDISRKRLEPLVQNVKRLGVCSILPVVSDSRKISVRSCQAVLLDVPCSGSGTLRRRADLRWRRQEADIGPLTRLQTELLESGASLLGVGGRLVYSTCSIEPDENEAIVSRFLRTHPNFVLQPVPEDFPPELVEEEHYLLTLPHEHGVDGAFACLLRKTGPE